MSINPFFVKCSVESTRYRGHARANNPVNLSLCNSIKKSRLRWYPDNDGIASIVFEGCDIEWAYNSESTRDADFDRITTNEHLN
jgi:hypothetical protein